MSEAQAAPVGANVQDPPAAPMAAPPVIPPAPPAPTGPAKVDMTSEQLSARLQEERQKAEKKAAEKFASELGVPIDVAKAAIARAKELEAANLSELEKKDRRIAELEAANAVARIEGAKPYAEAALKSLSDEQRQDVIELAGDDPVKQIRAVEKMRPLWDKAAKAEALAAAKAAESAEPPKPKPLPAPAHTAPQGGTPPVPGSTTTVDHLAEYERIQALPNGRAIASMYYARNAAAIDNARKARR